MAHDSLGEQPGLGMVALTRRDHPEPSTAITAMAELFVRGVWVDWASLVPGPGRRVVLPTYPFQRQRFWLGPGASVDMASGAMTSVAVGAGDARFWEAIERGDAEALASELQVDADQSLSAVLPVLSRWRRRHGELSVVDSWRYRVTWKPAVDLAVGMVSGRGLVVTFGG